ISKASWPPRAPPHLPRRSNRDGRLRRAARIDRATMRRRGQPHTVSEMRLLLAGTFLEAEIGAFKLRVRQVLAVALEHDLPAAHHVDPVRVLERSVRALFDHDQRIA